MKRILSLILLVGYFAMPLFGGSDKDKTTFLATGKCDHCDLSGFDLRNFNKDGKLKIELLRSDVTGTNFSGSNFNESLIGAINANKANFSDTTFKNTGIFESEMENANFSGAIFDQTILNNILANRANFSNTKLGNDSSIEHSKMNGCNFSGAQISKTNLEEVEANKANFSNATLVHTIVKKSTMDDANFSGIHMNNVAFDDGSSANNSNFTNAKIEECQFRKMKLNFAVFYNTKIIKSILHFADFYKARFKNTQISDSDLRHGTNFEGTRFKNTIFKNCRGLNHANFFDADKNGLTISEEKKS